MKSPINQIPIISVLNVFPVFTDPLLYSFLLVGSSSDQILGIVFVRGVQINTMSTVLAIYYFGIDVSFLGLLDTCPLPWVFFTIRHYQVVGIQIEAPELVVDSIHEGPCVLAENVIAPFPVEVN